MKKLKLLALISITLNLAAPISAAYGAFFNCQGRLREMQLYRPLSQFSRSVRAQFQAFYEQERTDQLRFAVESSPAISVLLNEMAQKLVKASQFDGVMTKLPPIEFVVREDRPGEIPHASIRAGVLSINARMLKNLEDDDELAAVIGEEILHHTLGHDLNLLREMNRPWMRFLKNRSNPEAFPLFKNANFFRELFALRMESLKDSHEAEVALRLPVLLANAGHDPWAIVDSLSRFLNQTRDAAPAYLDGHTRMKLEKKLQLIQERLRKKKLARKRMHRNDIISEIYDLIVGRKMPDNR